MKLCRTFCTAIVICTTLAAVRLSADDSSDLLKFLGISFSGTDNSKVFFEKDGKRYQVDTATRTVQEIAPEPAASVPASALFQQNCASCHGANGKGVASIHTPDFTNAVLQRSLSDRDLTNVIRNGKGNGRMPAWSGKLSDLEIDSLAAYVRTFSESSQKKGVYEPGDDLLFSLPTGREVEEHGLYVNFTHRFPYDPAFSGPGRAGELFGLDNFALASFGLRYGVTNRLSVSAFRSSSIIGRPIQLMAAYSVLDEHHEDPFNMVVRVSIEGQNNFRKNYAQNIEGIFSRSLTGRAQFYVVPTMSFDARPLVQASGFESSDIPDLPGVNTFSIGIGAAYDIRPTVALIAEVIPTLLNASELGIHRPAYSFGIQKKIFRHAFTLGLTTSPAVTVSQRAATRAEFLGEPSADTPSGLFFGFDLMRQIH